MKVFRLFIFAVCLSSFSACQSISDDNETNTMNESKKNKEEEGDIDMEQAFIKLAEAGDTEKMLELLHNGVDVNVTDSQGRTAVMAATQNHQTETVKSLIDQGADVDIRNHNEDNVLLYASAEGLLDIVKLAIEAGADTRLTNKFGGTGLIPAADRGHVDVVEELLKHSDVDVDHINNLDWTALLEAIILGDGGEDHTKIVQLLVAGGADVNISDGNGVSPLQHAEKNGYTEMEKILREAGGQ